MTRLEDQLRAALQQEEPPAGFADRVLGLAAEQDERRERSLWFQFRSMFAVRRLSWAAAAVALVVVASGVGLRIQEERRVEGEAAKRQVMLALRITSEKWQGRGQRDQQQNRYPERPVSSRHSPGHGEPGMKRLLLLLISLMLPAIVPAQEIRLPANLEKLSAKAVEVVEVNLDQRMLQLAARFMDPKDPDQQQAKKLIANLKSVYVRSFEFDKAGQYSEADLAEIRAQLQSPAWNRIVGVRSKREHENAEVYIKSDGDQITSLVIRCRGSERAHVRQHRRTDQA